MSKTNTFAAVATLFLAAIPAMSIASAAQAAPAAIKVSDLNLASPQGQRVFAQRTDAVALKLCRDTTGSRIPSAGCRAAVHAEAREKAAAMSPSMLASR